MIAHLVESECSAVLFWLGNILSDVALERGNAENSVSKLVKIDLLSPGFESISKESLTRSAFLHTAESFEFHSSKQQSASLEYSCWNGLEEIF